ncbi:MAG: mercury transporter MerT [Hyphomicrobiales bacterium]|nr:mercury transporter MerT [Hyphomicrobiales bacterium]
MYDTTTTVETPQTGNQANLLAAGGLVGGLLASTCCVLPLALVTLGVSGAWIGNLTALSPYQPYFLISAFGLLGAGFWRAYRKNQVACAPGSCCAVPESRRAAKTALWIGLIVTVAAMAVNFLPVIG